MGWIWLLIPVCLFGEWAEETLNGMTLDEKIGQLFMAPACPLRKEDHWADWMILIEDYQVGNAILKQSDPDSQVEFLNRLQERSEIPLLIGADAEWGLAMRMSGTIGFPRNMTLGAVQDLEKIYQMGKEIGREAKQVGIHMNFAPVVDVNFNPKNPIIGSRSFGDNPEEVAKRGTAFLRGMQDEGILACPKHFPGHGDTAVDSHVDLPFIPFDRERLDQVEFLPFRKTVEAGAKALMLGHLLVPSIDPIYPASLSKECIKIAREEWGFEGLIVTDALNMKALTNRYSPEEIAVLARRAGCDLLLFGAHRDLDVDYLLIEMIPRAITGLRNAYRDGTLDLGELNASVLRILKAKERLNLHQSRLAHIEDLSPPEALLLKQRLFEEAITQVGESFSLRSEASYLSFGEGDLLAEKFPPFSDKSEQVVIAVFRANLTEAEIERINAFSDRSILCLFCSPYALKQFPHHRSILIAYEKDPEAQKALYKVLTGEKIAKGILPISR